MLTSDQFSSLIYELLGQFGQGESADGNSSCKKGGDAKKNNLSPSQLLVIAALLSGVLEVAEVLISREQTVQIRLDGSLKRKTELDRTMEKIGGYSFDEVVQALMGRFT
ncbi:MAG: hypothetical protein HPY50_06035 [Firmicutes bacterium]|nr:hypothetical protein [Bacillota bacterium]